MLFSFPTAWHLTHQRRSYSQKMEILESMSQLVWFKRHTSVAVYSVLEFVKSGESVLHICVCSDFAYHLLLFSMCLSRRISQLSHRIWYFYVVI
ncbi:hypothetical protein OESDEN_02503 [Oesophagostomum dentatum]|uniref:Uncharacterized protein n=1 Tax=Oesophagostomum dentatum TaxID=61180 RepID=A0A0B1TQ37_OESDE|nr:hypothetical protein OESDEN_02503 [Oesophagostomum dentatum]